LSASSGASHQLNALGPLRHGRQRCLACCCARTTPAPSRWGACRHEPHLGELPNVIVQRGAECFTQVHKLQ